MYTHIHIHTYASRFKSMFILFVCVEGVSLTCVTINRLDYDYGVCVCVDRVYVYALNGLRCHLGSTN